MLKQNERTVVYNSSSSMYGYDNVRWVENASLGLRLVGYADKITRIVDHTGWYTDDDGVCETYRGVVYQLPARRGKPQYVYGYADPNNDDCALLVFDVDDNKEAAARHADRFAEVCAEHERDYQRAWAAGRRYEDLADDIAKMRGEALALCAEARGARKVVESAPTICRAIRDRVMALYRNIQKARKERETLLSDFGKCDGFIG